MTEIWDAFKAALVRFFDGLFLEETHEEFEYLKMQIEAERAERKVLIAHIINPVKVEGTEEVENPQPLIGHIPRRVRIQMAEKADREKARRMRSEASLAVEASKTTEELESELLGKVN